MNSNIECYVHWQSREKGPLVCYIWKIDMTSSIDFCSNIQAAVRNTHRQGRQRTDQTRQTMRHQTQRRSLFVHSSFQEAFLDFISTDGSRICRQALCCIQLRHHGIRAYIYRASGYHVDTSIPTSKSQTGTNGTTICEQDLAEVR